MLKFFRRFRESTLLKNNIGKYVIYAIGEIILVVIGILIALQVNNQNELSKEKAREQKFLRQIQEDLDQSTSTMRYTSEIFKKQAKAAAYITRAFWQPEEVVKDTFLTSLVAVFQSRREKPLVGTIESLINSGEINLIASDSLRNSIIDYLGFVEAKLSDIERYDETYYRPAIQKATLKINYAEIIRNYGNGFGELSPFPETISTIPYKNDYEALRADRDIYTYYNQFLVAHRNQAFKYSELAEKSEHLMKNITSYLTLYN